MASTSNLLPDSSSPAREALREDIQNIISKQKLTKPSFTTSELIVLAGVYLTPSEKASVTRQEIFACIVRNFPYYRLAAGEVFARNVLRSMEHKYYLQPTSGIGSSWSIHNLYDYLDVISDFDDVFGQYNLPISGARGKRARNCRDTVYCFPTKEACVFLRRLVEPKRQGAFRFLDLPPELRIRIYEMVFSFPDIGTDAPRCARDVGGHCLALARREHDPENPVYRGGHDNRTPQSGPVQVVFALLSVNKQIYHEAVPYFYRINHFKASSMRSLTHFVEGLARSRLKHVRHIAFPFHAHTSLTRRFQIAMERLAKFKSVKVLKIEAKDPTKEDLQAKAVMVNGRAKIWRRRRLEELPYLKELCQLAASAEKVVFSGKCPRIFEYVRAEMKKLGAEVRVEMVEEHGPRE